MGKLIYSMLMSLDGYVEDDRGASAGAPLGNLTYTYDNDGRRTQMGGSSARTRMPNATTSTALYNVANQLTNWKGGTLTYDLNGNLTSDGVNNYT